MNTSGPAAELGELHGGQQEERLGDHVEGERDVLQRARRAATSPRVGAEADADEGDDVQPRADVHELERELKDRGGVEEHGHEPHERDDGACEVQVGALDELGALRDRDGGDSLTRFGIVGLLLLIHWDPPRARDSRPGTLAPPGRGGKPAAGVRALSKPPELAYERPWRKSATRSGH
jgi:hypothetical protein